MANSGEHQFEKEIDKSVSSEQKMDDKPVFEREYDRQPKNCRIKSPL